MFQCCGEYHKGKFAYKIQKPYYRFLEFGICPKCQTKYFIDFKQVLDDEDNYKEAIKTFKGEAAQKEFNKWKRILNNSYQGSMSKEFFYFGTFTKSGNYFKTYRTNFNNKKEFLFKNKVNSVIV